MLLILGVVIMANKEYGNIFLEGHVKTEQYKKKGFSNFLLPKRDRKYHGGYIKKQLDAIWEKNEKKEVISLSSKNGTYLEFESKEKFQLMIKSLEATRQGIKLLNVREVENHQKATVYVPKGKENYFIKKVEDYLTKDNKSGPANANLIESIENIKKAVVESFWIGSKEFIPQEEKTWCELWLAIDDEEVNFIELINKLDIEVKNDTILFPERLVLLIKAENRDLQKLIVSLDNVAEIRRATETATFFLELSNKEQVDWGKDLKNRTKKGSNINTCISILDSGINNGHFLLEDFLKDEDCLKISESLDLKDEIGHGTKMAGVGLYGDLQKSLELQQDIYINHDLESYKLYSSIEYEASLYGAITKRAVSELIINKPSVNRIICMAITAPKYQSDDGSPSSWSAALDSIIFGDVDKQKKMFIISAGNVLQESASWGDYPNGNLASSVQNPAQSWNAITVGAYTEKDKSSNRNIIGGEILAKSGQLSPYSTTSFYWDKKWPIKPEIVLEGGNVIRDDNSPLVGEDDLSILTTNSKPTHATFTSIYATSASTAQASNLAARLMATYPNAWPETIRALLIHSADWTNEMKNQFLESETKKKCYRKLLRTCGYGVPNLEKAIKCIDNNVNIIIESELKPLKKVKSNYVSNEMKIHEIPWPKDELLKLGAISVNMRVTLSYFIEPGPGEIGWKDKYRYASCGLRFDVNLNENEESFVRRISSAMEQEEEEEVYEANSRVSTRWLLGANNRNVGSIHSDIWHGTAAELATSNLIAVYPTAGWWKGRTSLKKGDSKIRYSLIVSISTPEINVDLYNMVMTEIKSEIQLMV